MSTALLIATSFSLGFFVESIIGFGGGLIAYSLLGFFIDLKTMILAGLYIGTLSSAHIFLTDRQSFDKKIFLKMLPFSLAGTIIGVLFFSHLSVEILSAAFGILLLALAIKIMFFDHYAFPKFFQKKLIFTGGISHGAFGIGGPFWVNALKGEFKNKSALRTTMAGTFVAFNLIRIMQLSLQKEISLNFFTEIWWTILPVFLAIKLGHLAHLKISEELFKKGIALMTIFASLKFISKIF